MSTPVRTLIEWTDAAGATGALEVDATKTRGWELAAEVTEFPVDTGSAITDHVRPTNGTVSIEGVISNTPVALPTTQMQGITLRAGSVVLPGGDGKQKATLFQWSDVFDRRKVCDGILAGLVAASTPVRLTTSLRTVQNLAITRYKVDETAETGQALHFVMEFKALRIATTARAPVPAVRRLQVPQSRAVQPPDNRSLLARALDGGAPATSARTTARGS